MPVVSVIMPVRNAREYVAAAVSSILRQTVTDLELIVVDDGCTDNSIEIARSVSDTRVTFIDGPRRGPGAARNAGAGRASAPWLAFMDADDISEPTRLSEQLCALTTDPTLSAIGCSSRAIDEQARWLVDIPTLQHPDAIAAAAYSFGPLCGATVVILRAVFDRVGGFTEEPILCEDYDLLCRLLRTEARIGSLGAPLYLYRWHASFRSADHDRMVEESAAVRCRHWELAPPVVSLSQVRGSRAPAQARLHASAFIQLAIGMIRRRRFLSAIKITLATTFYNPRGVLELIVGEVRKRWTTRAPRTSSVRVEDAK